MRIRRLEIEGFRSLKDTTWCPGDLNVLVGPNGSGKSNLLRALELMGVASHGSLGRYIQDSGGMEPLVWDGQSEGIGFRLETAPSTSQADPRSGAMTYQVRLIRLGSGSGFRITKERLAICNPAGLEHGEEPSVVLDRGVDGAVVLDQTGRRLIIPKESVPDDETLLSVAGGMSSINGSIGLFQAQMAAWCVYHDVRFHRNAPIGQSVVPETKRRVGSDGRNLVSVLHTLYTSDCGFRAEVDGAMGAAFGEDFLGIEFPQTADGRVELRLRWRSSRRGHLARDISYGVWRFLFLLAVLGNPNPAPLIAIDGPETGLHPSMLPIVAEFAMEASRKSQVILTTHSPQLLDALGVSMPTMTVFECVRGKTELRVLSRDSLLYWLAHYSLGALFRSGELEALPSDPEVG